MNFQARSCGGLILKLKGKFCVPCAVYNQLVCTCTSPSPLTVERPKNQRTDYQSWDYLDSKKAYVYAEQVFFILCSLMTPCLTKDSVLAEMGLGRKGLFMDRRLCICTPIRPKPKTCIRQPIVLNLNYCQFFHDESAVYLKECECTLRCGELLCFHNSCPVTVLGDCPDN